VRATILLLLARQAATFACRPFAGGSQPAKLIRGEQVVIMVVKKCFRETLRRDCL
jgi:hypothetical protein